MYELEFQRGQLSSPDEVQILSLADDGEIPTGAKRNWLVDNCNGLYFANFDDDDLPTDVYLEKQLEVAKSGKDCGSFNGLYFSNGVYDRPFIHSLKYSKWYSDDKAHYRSINHLNAVKKEAVKDFRFEEIYIGEDHKWSDRVREAGVLKTEHRIEETLYLYYHKTKK